MIMKKEFEFENLNFKLGFDVDLNLENPVLIFYEMNIKNY